VLALHLCNVSYSGKAGAYWDSVIRKADGRPSSSKIWVDEL